MSNGKQYFVHPFNPNGQIMKKTAAPFILLVMFTLVGCSARVTTRSLPDTKSVAPIKVLVQKADAYVSVSGTSAFALRNEGETVDLAIVSGGQKVQLRRVDGMVEFGDGQSVTGKASRLVLTTGAAEGRFELGGKSYRGTLTAFVADSVLHVVNTLDMESYLMGVVRNEIGRVSTSELEAAKAQAIAARTYAVRNKGKYKNGYDFVADVNDQVYGGASSESDLTNQAVLETVGQIAEFEDKPINAVYFSTCGGATASAEDVWKTSDRTAYLTRLSDIVDDRAFCEKSPHHRWELKWTGDELEQLIKKNLPLVLQKDTADEDFSKLAGQRLYNLAILTRDSSQRVRDLKIGFTRDSYVVSGEQARRVLRGEKYILYSSLFRIDIDRNDNGTIRTVVCKGAGFGHGVGMCQYGALEMARRGYSADQIIRFYYRGAVVKKAY
jgi:stage II sporulation protein D